MKILMSIEEQEELLELRARGSQKARSHQVQQDRCPGCGAWLAADLVKAIKRGEQRCPTSARITAVFRASVDDLLDGITRLRGGAA